MPSYSFILIKIKGLFLKITCVLDGLDECEPISLGPMLKKLNEVTSTAPRLKIVIVSREYPQCIRASLYKFPKIRLDPDAQREVSEGLDQYISTRVTELSESNRYPAKLADHVYDVLKRKSAGTYLWVSFVIEDLQAVKISEVEKCLERFPRGLDGLYARLLEQVDPACRETTLDILRWCAFTGPVTSDFLSDALNITSTGLLDREAVLQGHLAHCGHFLSITGHRIDLVHRSAHDFLTTCTRTSPSNALCWFSLSHIEAEHSKLASACISHICTHNPKATLENYSSSEAMEGSFVGHAHRAWIHHFHHSGPEGVRILDEHPKFFSGAPQSWTTKAYWGLSEYPEGLAAAAARIGLTVLMQRIIKEDGSWLYVKDSLAHFAGQPLVHIGAAWGHAPIADILLKNYKTLVNGKDVDGNTPLHHAALHGHLDVVKVLVKYGARIDSRGSNGQTPLYKALISSEKQVAEYLLELGANANASDKAGSSPLTHAVHRGDPSMVKLLLDWGADSQLRESDGSSSDVARALRRHPGTLMVFLESLAKRSDSEPSEFRDGIDFADTTALHIACQAGDLAAMCLLLDPKWGLDVNQQDDDENTPLHWAAGGGKVGAVELLLTQPGIDPTLLNEEGHSALHTALMRGRLNVVWYLLNNCNLSIHEPHAECGWGALHLVIFSQPCPRFGEPASTL